MLKFHKIFIVYLEIIIKCLMYKNFVKLQHQYFSSDYSMYYVVVTLQNNWLHITIISFNNFFTHMDSVRATTRSL